ncbi:Uncharacterized protein OBRU01_15799 [Operophtera brumata]|uniref:Uncharacterized protein n=1 Tax=Operophtera brumata TaxID=104452 RepID=A0A0L7L3X1_OPEBR|nr:Uncharacterized protein OBRU01_15799 [Operophtera brumata]
MMLAGAQIVDNGSVAYSQASQAPQEAPRAVSEPMPSQAPLPPAQAAQGLARVPTTDPVDIHFSNITCTVKLGINKGKFLNA